MRRLQIATLALTAVLGGAANVWADATVFIGATTTPENRRAEGIAVGAGLLLFAFEFEYANTQESDDTLATPAPALRTGMGNILLQAPLAIFGFQPYITAGAGLYRETLAGRRETGFGSNVGGGVKVTLAGPLRLRVDYRQFRLGNGALHSPAHRVYAGLNLRF